MNSAIKAELKAVLTGLELAAGLSFDNICVECDSLSVIHLLINLQVDDAAESSFMVDISDVLKRFSRVKFMHRFRKGNACADALANYSFVQEEAYSVFVKPPQVLDLLLLYDCMGLSYPRQIVDTGMRMG